MMSNDGLGSSGGGSDSDSFITGFGLVVAICAAALLFGGETFIWWTVSWEGESTTPLTYDDGSEFDFEFEMAVELGMEEMEMTIEIDMWDAEDSSKEDLTEGSLDETNATKYTDDDCECDETKTFFTNLKYMVYGLLVCGLALVYVGQTGQEEHASTLAIVGALISAGILAYTFVTLPDAFEEDTQDDDGEEGFFEGTMNEDPAFILNSGKEEYDDDFETDVKSYAKARPDVAYFVPVITLTLFGYLIYYNHTKEPLPERKSYAGINQWSKASNDSSESIKELDLDNLLGKETSGSDDRGDMPSVTEVPELPVFKAHKKDVEEPEMTKIECPECESLMMVPKLDQAQQVKCDACGLEGEITI
tara:strand:+ start:95 stop:1180 length:1086 start_codon:yes stop_codon:yes gene_type:complete